MRTTKTKTTRGAARKQIREEIYEASPELVDFFLRPSRGLCRFHNFHNEYRPDFKRGGLSWGAMLWVEQDRHVGLSAGVSVSADVVEEHDIDEILKGLRVLRSITRELRRHGYGVLKFEADHGTVAGWYEKRLAGVEEARRELEELKDLDLSGRKSRR